MQHSTPRTRRPVPRHHGRPFAPRRPLERRPSIRSAAHRALAYADPSDAQETRWLDLFFPRPLPEGPAGIAPAGAARPDAGADDSPARALWDAVAIVAVVALLWGAARLASGWGLL